MARAIGDPKTYTGKQFIVALTKSIPSVAFIVELLPRTKLTSASILPKFGLFESSQGSVGTSARVSAVIWKPLTRICVFRGNDPPKTRHPFRPLRDRIRTETDGPFSAAPPVLSKISVDPFKRVTLMKVNVTICTIPPRLLACTIAAMFAVTVMLPSIVTFVKRMSEQDELRA